MKNSIYFILIGVSFLYIGCTKDKLDSGECIEIDQLTDMQGMPLFHVQYPSYGVPCFNPNNSEEVLLFYAKENDGPPHSLIKYNLKTKTYETFYEGLPQFRPRWGKNGWILLPLWNELGNDGFNIWKIKSNGDSLTQLTFSGNCHTPDWNITSDKFIYKLGFTTPTKYIMADEFGNFIDTIYSGLASPGSWQHDSLIVNTSSGKLILGNPYTGEANLIYQVEELSSISNGGAEWINLETIIWAHVTGIYKTNIKTNTTEIIKETCNASYYQLPTYSPQSNKIIFQRIDRMERGSEGGDLHADLYIMNIDGSEEEKIEISD